MIQKCNITRIVLTIVVSLLFGSISAQKTYLVCVGLNVNRDNIDPLPCSRGDMKGIANFYHQYNKSDVFMLLDANATKKHILKILKQQFAKATPNDEIIFAYSGHGFDGGLSTYNNDEVLFCSEVQSIMLQAKARRKMMFVMSCHSGSFTKKNDNIQDPRRKYNKSSKVLLFLSSRADELSWEAMSMDNSFFFHFLLEGLKGSADDNGDKKVTARELFNYVSPRVNMASSGIQHPVMWGKFPDDMVIVNVK
ncbi:MAG: caspase domain-containing protein [Prevotella sp.]